MKEYLEENENTLLLRGLKPSRIVFKNFGYHWLWGLVEHEENSIANDIKAAQECNDFDNQFKRHLKVVMRVSQYNSFLRMIYWLFNIENYAYRSYFLLASIAFHTIERHTEQKEDEVLLPKSLESAPWVTKIWRWSAYKCATLVKPLEVKEKSKNPRIISTMDLLNSTEAKIAETRKGLIALVNTLSTTPEERRKHLEVLAEGHSDIDLDALPEDELVSADDEQQMEGHTCENSIDVYASPAARTSPALSASQAITAGAFAVKNGNPPLPHGRNSNEAPSLSDIKPYYP